MVDDCACGKQLDFVMSGNSCIACIEDNKKQREFEDENGYNEDHFGINQDVYEGYFC